MHRWQHKKMCLEAYTLHDALTGYLKNETGEQTRMRAVKAYSLYQKCGVAFPVGLLVAGGVRK